jgi:hypothetical protein
MSRRTRRRLLLALTAVVVVAVAVAGFLYWRSRDALADPATVALPAQEADDGTLATYFQGAGAPLLRVLDQASGATARASAADCATLGGALDGVATPDALMAAAHGVPDPTVSDAAVSYLGALADYLNACGTPHSLGDLATRVHFTATVLQRLLVRAGVR